MLLGQNQRGQGLGLGLQEELVADAADVALYLLLSHSLYPLSVR